MNNFEIFFCIHSRFINRYLTLSPPSCRVPWLGKAEVLEPLPERRRRLSRRGTPCCGARFEKDRRICCLLCGNTVLPVLAQHAMLQSPSPDGKGWQMVNNVSRKSLNSYLGYPVSPNFWQCNSRVGGKSQGLLWASDLSATRYTW